MVGRESSIVGEAGGVARVDGYGGDGGGDGGVGLGCVGRGRGAEARRRERRGLARSTLGALRCDGRHGGANGDGVVRGSEVVRGARRGGRCCVAWRRSSSGTAVRGRYAAWVVTDGGRVPCWWWSILALPAHGLGVSSRGAMVWGADSLRWPDAMLGGWGPRAGAVPELGCGRGPNRGPGSRRSGLIRATFVFAGTTGKLNTVAWGGTDEAGGWARRAGGSQRNDDDQHGYGLGWGVVPRAVLPSAARACLAHSLSGRARRSGKRWR